MLIRPFTWHLDDSNCGELGLGRRTQLSDSDTDGSDSSEVASWSPHQSLKARRGGACAESVPCYASFMSATELLQQVKNLPPGERRRFFTKAQNLEERLTKPTLTEKKNKVQWPDMAARRRKIMGDRVLPNLILLAREDERY